MQTLSFSYCNQSDLTETLRSHAQFDGLVATSGNALVALQYLYKDNHESSKTGEDDPLSFWRQKPLFVVGKSTASYAHALNYPTENIIIGEGGAHELSKVIGTHFQVNSTNDKKINLLFLCGNKRRDELIHGLTELHINAKELVVYNTNLTPSASEIVDRIMSSPPDWVVFFSPSSLESSSQVLPFSDSAWAGVRYAAFGPTTAAAVEGKFGHVEAVPQTPQADALVQAIVLYDSQSHK